MNRKILLKFFTTLRISVLVLSCGTKEKRNKYKIAEEIVMKYCKLFLFALFLISCNRDVKKQSDILIINFEQEQSIDPSNIFETDFIKLETNENCLMDKSIRQIEFIEDKIFILTGGEANLLVFDLSGNYISKIGNRGSGPGEYILLFSFSIDMHRNIISAVDGAQQKVMNYSLNDYKFISEHKTRTMCFEYLGTDKIVWNNFGFYIDDNEWNFTVTDINQNPAGKYVKKDIITGYSTGPLKNMYKSDNEVYAWPLYNSVIYRFGDEKVVPFYKLQFGKYKLPPLDYLKSISANNVNFLSELNHSEYVYNFSVFDAGKFLGVYYLVSKNYYLGIYDKNSNRTYNYSLKEFQNSMKTGVIEKIAGVMNNYIVATLQPFDLLSLKAENYAFPEKLRDLLDRSQDDDNPVLFLFRLKTDI
jgi:hypothetical protein